jgi:CoA:oxalate CoA-transferase
VERLLEGVRVVDLTHAYAGPLCTYNLALLGADVVKVEPPQGGDDFRVWLESSFVAINAGKRSIALDLKRPEGREILARLLAGADVLVENYRPGVAARLGVDWDELQASNPRLVYCSITGFGDEGPLRDAPSIEWAMQAAAGVSTEYLTADDPPERQGLAVVDAASGLTAVTAILAALYRRERTGEGARIDIAMMDAAFGLLSAKVAEAANPGARRGPQLPASGRFQASDRALYVSAVHEKWFRGLCEALGVPELPEDPRFASPEERTSHRDELHELLAERFRSRTAEEWQAELNARGIPASVVRTLEEAVRHPQAEQRRLLHEVGSARGPVKVMGNPFSLPGLDQSPRPARVPELGEHTDQILAEIGWS